MRHLRQHSARATAIVVIVAAALLTRPAEHSEAERSAIASRFSFERLELRSASRAPQRSVRDVQPQLRRISAWISAVGAAVTLADLDEDGLPNDACLVDPRTDSVTVQPAPGTATRYAAFLLEPASLPYDRGTMAPMGCLPGDFDEDGRTDLLVYYWGRSPAIFIRRADGDPAADAYHEHELVAGTPRWFTDSVTSADVDGDGHLDLVVGNYFPDGARVLDPSALDDPGMEMQDSMSRAHNGGINRILLGRPGTGGSGMLFAEARGALPPRIAAAWTLAIAAADLNGDALPELYFGNDFGPDHLLVNASTPGRVRLREVHGVRGLTTPASKQLGRDSFKGMGVDFGDLNGDGRYDIVVSNIATEFALMESNFAFLNTGAELAWGQRAPFVDRSEQMGLARAGWGWDIKLGDFDNDATPEVVQATGFIRGRVNRWPELHELATANDGVLKAPSSWPRFQPGDDVSGHDSDAFFVMGSGGRFANLGEHIGIADSYPSRGIAMADVDADGRLDMAIAGQWAPSYLYLNKAPRSGNFLGLDVRLALRPGTSRTRIEGYPGSGTTPTRAAVGASVRVTLPDGRRLIGQVDGGNGHASVRAPQLIFGLGRVARGVPVELTWRSTTGAVRRTNLRLVPGWHTVVLGDS